MERNVCVVCNTEKSIDNFTIYLENVNPVILEEV